jgi:hypothetical protein
MENLNTQIHKLKLELDVKQKYIQEIQPYVRHRNGCALLNKPKSHTLCNCGLDVLNRHFNVPSYHVIA